MTFARRHFLHFAAGAAALPVASRLARAQGYSSRQLTTIVPFAAGGPADTVGRILAERMRSSLGQTIVLVTALLKSEIETWWPMIKAAKIKGE